MEPAGHRVFSFDSPKIAPGEVHARLSRHMLLDGLDLVVDLERSRGHWLVDARNGERYLDLYSFFASAPLGLNPPEIVDDPAFLSLLGDVAVNKPANPDMYTTHLAEFVDTFARVLGDASLPHLFFIEGGALAVENALKCAFDWKSHHNEARDRSPALGTKVMHLTRAFHGRSGYTLSLTNTDPIKIGRYPKFDWPRLDVPALRHPVEDGLEEVRLAEERAIDQAERAFAAYPDDIACFIAEPIQGEGGDNHIRQEFLQAMQELCHQHDALFILDEVQTGCGLTGTAWAYQQMALEPDVVAFGKKLQVGGIMAGRRVDEVPNNVFTVSGRISSTWGGSLVDMVRSRRLLEAIEEGQLIPRAGKLGEWLLGKLHELCSRHEHLVSNVRGRGLMCAFDLPDASKRNDLLDRLREEERVLMLPSGTRAVRFLPPLSITEEGLQHGIAALDRALERLDHSARSKPA